jgi:hypothetical protein
VSITASSSPIAAASTIGWCELLADYWPVDFAITASSPDRHSVSAREPTFPDRPAECFLSQRQLPLGLTQFFSSGSECFIYRGPDDPRLDNVHMQ